MAQDHRRIIVIGSDSSAGNVTITAYLWLTSPVKRGYRGAQKSRLPPANATYTWGITPAEQALFDSGMLLERGVQVGPFVDTVSKNQVRAALEQRYAAEQAALDATASSGPNVVGDSYDGAAWTASP